jgi:diguanylate cyclase (GGDEF)-like protein
MAIANVRMRDELRDQSVRDPLTGLFNRRHMAETLRKMIAAAGRDGAPLAVVSGDVDHFKKFNDAHGHDAGDIALRSVGSALEQFCHGAETACRVGGEEFLLLLPGVGTTEAVKRLEALRRRIEEISVRYGGRLLPNITASFGLAQCPGHGDNPTDLIRSSDEALYAAKAKGRNRVEIAGGDEEETGKRSRTAPGPGGPLAQANVRADVAAE